MARSYDSADYCFLAASIRAGYIEAGISYTEETLVERVLVIMGDLAHWPDEQLVRDAVQLLFVAEPKRDPFKTLAENPFIS